MGIYLFNQTHEIHHSVLLYTNSLVAYLFCQRRRYVYVLGSPTILCSCHFLLVFVMGLVLCAPKPYYSAQRGSCCLHLLCGCPLYQCEIILSILCNAFFFSPLSPHDLMFILPTQLFCLHLPDKLCLSFYI